MRRFLLLYSASLWSCGGTSPAPMVAEQKVEPTEAAPSALATNSYAYRLKQTKDTHKHLMVFWGDKGVWVETASGETLVVFTAEPSAHPSLTKDALYYMASEAGEIRRVDLKTNSDRLIAKLPKLDNPCFDNTNPIDYIQAYYDVGWDHSAGELCFRINDRNENMASVSMELRVGLKSGQVESSTLLAFNECKTPEFTEGERLCTSNVSASPGEPEKGVNADALAKGIALLTEREGKPEEQFAEMLSYGSVSPSGKWIQFSDFELEGDYIYSGLLFFSLEEGKVYAVGSESESLVPLDYVALSRRKNAYDPPDGICMLPGESLKFWSESPDLFVVDTCVAGIGVLDLNKKARARSVDAVGAFLY